MTEADDLPVSAHALSPLPSSQPDVERPRAAVGAARLLEPEHHRAHVRLTQPVRHEAAKDAGLVDPTGRGLFPAFSGDDYHQLGALSLRLDEKPTQRMVSLSLVHPVQVDRAVDGGAAA